ncbi:MAG TPA: NrfD/PsrC family molybdoenzyme membrane anchor subunit [Symbiobacteriaceae bacterium]|nr:NrfD/PsrC family molybdoenzyme membrane anchor subunit [Symbiobacteriaceae bacterium]
MKQGWWRWKFTPLKGILLALFGISAVVAIYRLIYGLGAVTNMSDTTPWGIWKAFDVVIVIPLGASGFTMAFVRYFLKDARYEHIMRRSVIWAAIAYLSAGTRLMFDIGLPWRLANPLVLGGNFHSPLLEVAWCMALYMIVLFFENIPRVMERMGVPWILKLEHFLHKIMPGFVLVGVLLSTMHHSTLGTLFMITGKRMDGLWYHPWLNYLFLLTSIAAGLAVTILIEGWSNHYYKTPFHAKLLGRLGTAMAAFLGVALLWRVGSIAAEGGLGLLAAPRFQTVLWWGEILVGYLLPIAILLRPRLRTQRWPLIIAAGATVGGMMVYRLNVAFTAMAANMKSTYVPALPELLFTIGATAGTMVIYTWFVETLPAILGPEASVTEDSPMHAD